MPNQVIVELSASDASMVAAWQHAKENISAFEEKLKSTHKTSEDFTDRLKGGFKEMGHEMIASYAGVEGIKKGIELLSDAYGDWTKKIKENLKSQQDNRAELTATLAMAGKLSDSPMIEEGLKHISGATRAEKKATFTAIAESAPTLSAKGQLDLAAQIAPLGAVVGEKGVAELGKLSGSLATAAPERSAFDLANIATAAGGQVTAARRGELADPSTLKTLGILQHQAGMPLEKALAFETTAMQKGLVAKDIEKFADALVDPMEAEKHHQPKSHEDVLRMKFARMDLGHRQEALLHDKQTAQAVLKNREATRFAEIGTGADWAKNEATLIHAHEGAGKNADLIAEQKAIHNPDSIRREVKMEKEAHVSQEAGKREPWEIQMDLGKEKLLHTVGRTWLTEGIAEGGGALVDAAHGLIPESGREWLRNKHIEMSMEDLRNRTEFDELSKQAEEAAPKTDVMDFGDARTGHRDIRRNEQGQSVPTKPPYHVTGRPGDTSIAIPPGGGPPTVNSRSAPEREEHGSLVAELRQQTALLQQIAAGKQPAPVVNVHMPAGSPSPRVNATERPEPSWSTALSASH